jgi:glycosyltransferase involved in cell wall biosynthesis
MSFGIPTVSYPEPCFSELRGYYLKAENIDKLVEKIGWLRDKPELYKKYSDMGIIKSEDYHIENIIKLYKKL